MSRNAWEQERRARIVGKKTISVKVSDLSVAVNVSARQFQGPGLGPLVDAALRTSGLGAHLLEMAGLQVPIVATVIGEVRGAGWVRTARSGTMIYQMTIGQGRNALTSPDERRGNPAALPGAFVGEVATLTNPFLELSYERILERWEQSDVFGRSLAQTKDGPVWAFYDGPPTANGSRSRPAGIWPRPTCGTTSVSWRPSWDASPRRRSPFSRRCS